MSPIQLTSMQWCSRLEELPNQFPNDFKGREPVDCWYTRKVYVIKSTDNGQYSILSFNLLQRIFNFIRDWYTGSVLGFEKDRFSVISRNKFKNVYPDMVIGSKENKCNDWESLKAELAQLKKASAGSRTLIIYTDLSLGEDPGILALNPNPSKIILVGEGSIAPDEVVDGVNHNFDRKLHLRGWSGSGGMLGLFSVTKTAQIEVPSIEEAHRRADDLSSFKDKCVFRVAMA